MTPPRAGDVARSPATRARSTMNWRATPWRRSSPARSSRTSTARPGYSWPSGAANRW